MSDERTAVELIALAAWMGVDSVAKIPPENRTHTCEGSMKAWKRVAEAMLEFYDICGTRTDALGWQPIADIPDKFRDGRDVLFLAPADFNDAGCLSRYSVAFYNFDRWGERGDQLVQHDYDEGYMWQPLPPEWKRPPPKRGPLLC